MNGRPFREPAERVEIISIEGMRPNVKARFSTICEYRLRGNLAASEQVGTISLWPQAQSLIHWNGSLTSSFAINRVRDYSFVDVSRRGAWPLSSAKELRPVLGMHISVIDS